MSQAMTFAFIDPDFTSYNYDQAFRQPTSPIKLEATLSETPTIGSSVWISRRCTSIRSKLLNLINVYFE